MNTSRGYTLIELMVAVGLFAIIMTLAAGAYLLMINANRQAQARASGINNLAFAAETMLRTIRTGRNYTCGTSGDCTNGGTTFSVIDQNGAQQTFSSANGAITQNGIALTDPSVTITSLTFYARGTAVAPTDYLQPYAIVTITGTVSAGPNATQSFNVETSAAMRGSDI